MTTFVMLSVLGPDGSATLRENPKRIKEVNAEVEAMGATVKAQYALLGQWDFITIIDAPDAVAMGRIATTLAARGTLKTTTFTAIPVDEFIASLGEGVGESKR
jgi:uncharacterized protein with GYD domain